MTDRHPPFDPELEPVLRQVEAEYPAPSFTPDLLLELREREAKEAPSYEDLRRGGSVRVEEITVPSKVTPSGLDLLILRPTSGVDPTAAIYNVHGGGMIVGNNRHEADLLAAWVEEFEVVGVSPEYRLAPECPHPAPVEDCYLGLRWVAENATTLGIDADRILVSGMSAGGGLAAALALMARESGGPRLSGQLLMSPMLDDRFETASSRELEGEGLWDQVSNRTGWEALLGTARGTGDVSQYAAPARATDLSELPPAFLDVGSTDVFRDEVLGYAAGIWRGGGEAELHVWPGGFHSFDLFAPEATLSRRARTARSEWLEGRLR